MRQFTSASELIRMYISNLEKDTKVLDELQRKYIKEYIESELLPAIDILKGEGY